MEFRLSDDYIRNQGGFAPRLIAFNLFFLAILALSIFHTEDRHLGIATAIFAVVSVIFCVITALQIRRASRTYAELRLRDVRIELADEGLKVVTASGTQTTRYDWIKSATLSKRRWRRPAVVVVSTRSGDIALPGIDRPEDFVTALGRRLTTGPTPAD